MNLNNLKVPLIVYWDINPLSDITQHAVHSICDGLVRNRIFVINIWDSSPTIRKETSLILKRLRNENINITLTINNKAVRSLELREFMPALKKILIHYETLEQLTSGLEKIKSYQIEELPVGIAFFVDEETYRNIPDVLKLCLEAGIKDIHIPIQRPKSDQGIFYPDEEITGWLLNEIKDIKKDNLNINVHDPFLWTIFNNGVATKDTKGCQGANTMVYISGDLDITPCPLLPIVLGNLKSTTLTEIFLSHERQQSLRRLSIPPEECRSCDRLNECSGGCRGRAYILYKTFDKRDPACNYS